MHLPPGITPKRIATANEISYVCSARFRTTWIVGYTFRLAVSIRSIKFFRAYFSFCPIRGKETDKSLTVEAMIVNSYSIALIFFFKSSIRELEDEKVWVTVSAILCWLSRIFERTLFCATTFSTCQFKAASAEETCFLVPSELVPIGF